MSKSTSRSSSFQIFYRSNSGQGRGDLFECEVLRWAVHACLPVEEHHSVAFGRTLLRFYAELLAHRFDPCGRALELGVDANGCLVQEDVAGARLPLRAELLVAKDRFVAELREYLGQCGRIFNRALGLDSNLVARVHI